MEAVLKRKLGRESRDYLAITFGLICYSLGWAAFLLPYQITTGGVTGIAAIIYYATGVEIQVSYFVINAVFLGFALKILGPRFSVKTIYAIFMLTFLLWLFPLQDGLVILTVFAQFMSVCSSAGFFYKILGRLQIFLIACHLI